MGYERVALNEIEKTGKRKHLMWRSQDKLFSSDHTEMQKKHQNGDTE